MTTRLRRRQMAQSSRRRKRTGQPPAVQVAQATIIERMGPPLARVPWSPKVVAQSLEILPVTLARGKLAWLRPLHAPSLRVGLPRTVEPSHFVLEVMAWYPLIPRVVHSTSWRYEDDRVVLTYVAVVEPPEVLPPGSLETVDVGRAELARGDSVSPPESINIEAVLEHAIRHLSWLLRDDPAIAVALHDWSSVLEVYRPEPFRALG